MSTHPMIGFDPQFTTPEEYILGVTYEIWEGGGVDTLLGYYAPDIPVRSAAGVVIGNRAVIDATRATMAEFPDRELLGEDIIWSDDGDDGFLSSHRLMSTATHVNDGAYGPASGAILRYRIIADCATRSNTIYDEWLVRDQGAIVRQIGVDPRDYAAQQIEAESQAGLVVRPFHPDNDIPATYRGEGNSHRAGTRYAQMVSDLVAGETSHVETGWDRGVNIELPGDRRTYGWAGARSSWGELTRCFPSARFEIQHCIGRDDPGRGERAALRWSFTGTHDGPGVFGPPTGVEVHVMGLSHAEFGPSGLRREFLLWDETAIWKQILLGAG